MKKQKVQAKINLETLAGGAFAEKLNEALMQVAENIQNPNTEATTKRHYDPDTGEVYETAGQPADDRQTTSGRNNMKVVKIAPAKEA